MSQSSQVTPSVSLHRGSCHCGAVHYEVTVDAGHGTRCNCSFCTKASPLGALVKPDAFKVTAGESNLSQYVWGTGVGTRFFCKQCGVHVFGTGNVPELGGDFVSLNLNTFDDIDPAFVEVIYWDGRHDNWQAGPRPSPWPIDPRTSDSQGSSET